MDLLGKFIVEWHLAPSESPRYGGELDPTSLGKLDTASLTHSSPIVGPLFYENSDFVSFLSSFGK